MDEFLLSVHSVILGEGKPLFIDVEQRVNQKMGDTKFTGRGVILMLSKGYSLPKIYWIILIPLILVIGSVNFIEEIQKYSFNDLEDLGRYFFIIVCSLYEAFIYMLLIWGTVSLLKYIFKNN